VTQQDNIAGVSMEFGPAIREVLQVPRCW